MSYELEYKRKIYKLPPRYANSDEPDYFAIVQQGSNNDYWASGEDAGKRTRKWELIRFGWAYYIIQKVCERAGYTEGGGLQFVNGTTKPENYLKLYRKEIENAKGIEQFFSDFVIKEAYVRVEKANILKFSDLEKDLYDELRKTTAWKSRDGQWDDIIFTTELTTTKDLKDWLRYKSLGKYAGFNFREVV